jgi:hypothetical protein
VGSDLLRSFDGDAARAFLLEHEAHGVRARVDGGEGVVKVRDPADFDPRHKGSFEL